MTNNGPSNASGASVADSIPALLAGVTWTSTTTGSASVSSGGSGSGNSLAATVNIAAGAGNSVIFTVSGDTDWCLGTSDLVDTATVTAPSGTTDSNPNNNSATDTVTFIVGQTPFTVTSAGDDLSGHTLRDAINAVNAGTADSIVFAIPGTPTINLAADLPAIDNPANIDGTTEPGVTVDGNGYLMLDVSSIVNAKDLLFTDGKITVETSGTLNVESNFNVGDFTTVNNYGTVDVCGCFQVGLFASLTNNGSATFSTDSNFTLGDGGFVSNGASSSDNATLTVGGSLSIGVGGFMYNNGSSIARVADNFSLGDGGFVYNGNSDPNDDGDLGNATLTVGGSFSALSDPSNGLVGFVYNLGTSTINVTGDFTLGDGDFVANGASSSAAVTFTVGGSLIMGGGGAICIQPRHLEHDGDRQLHDGRRRLGDQRWWWHVRPRDPHGRRSFGLGANSIVSDNGTSDLSVTGNFTLGDTSYFQDYGSMSVGGTFDPGPGTGDPSTADTVSGTFNALSGSSVTTNTATWEVLAGGHLDVAAGATFTVASGGTLDVQPAASRSRGLSRCWRVANWTWWRAPPSRSPPGAPWWRTATRTTGLTI